MAIAVNGECPKHGAYPTEGRKHACPKCVEDILIGRLSLIEHVRRRLEEATHEAINFKGMSAGSPQVRISIHDAQVILDLMPR